MTAQQPPAPILMVDLDDGLDSHLAEQLAADGFELRSASTVRHALSLGAQEPPALLLLRCGRSPRAALDPLIGLAACAHPFAAQAGFIPSIVIGSSVDELEVLRAFEAGADDYVSCATSYLELRARMRALLRRSFARADRERRLAVRSLAIDPIEHSARVDGVELSLRPLEFALLLELARDPRRVFRKAELLASVWGYRSPGSTRTVDIHASRLRRKLCADGPDSWIITVRGVGYRLI